jgi:Flp pilus assembly protein TadD
VGDYNALGRFEEAERAYRQSLAIWAQIQGSNNEIDSADPLVSLGSNLQLQGRYREAESLFHQVMEIATTHQSRSSVHWLA